MEEKMGKPMEENKTEKFLNKLVLEMGKEQYFETLFDKNQFPEVELFDDYDYWEKKMPLSVITEKWVLENLTFKELKYFFKSYLRAYFETNHLKIQMKALDLLKIEKEKREDTSKDEKKSKRTNHR